MCPYSWSVPGGVQSHVAGLARTLVARGHEVDVIAPADGPVDFPGFVAVGGSAPIHDNDSVVRVALSPLASVRTAQVLERGAYDLVHIHEPAIPAVSLTAALTVWAPLVGTFHMYAEGPRWYRPFAPVARAAIERLDERIAVSRAARDHVARVVPGRYRVIPNGVETVSVRRRHGSDRVLRVVFVGRPDPRKGLEVLLEAVRRLPGGVTLDLVGVPPDALPAGTPADVTAHGRVTDEERTRLLAAADVLCAPSLRGESFGIVLVEGMAAGLPVVASAIPGYVDVLPPGCGRLLPPGDPAALAGALAELAADPALRARLGAAGRRRARRYAWSNVVERIVAVYETAIRAHAERPGPPRPPDYRSVAALTAGKP